MYLKTPKWDAYLRSICFNIFKASQSRGYRRQNRTTIKEKNIWNKMSADKMKRLLGLRANIQAQRMETEHLTLKKTSSGDFRNQWSGLWHTFRETTEFAHVAVSWLMDKRHTTLTFEIHGRCKYFIMLLYLHFDTGYFSFSFCHQIKVCL